MKLKDDTVAGDIAIAPSVTSKDKKKKKIIKESDNYSFYKDPNGQDIFEITNSQDFQVFRQGLNAKNPKLWRGNDTCQELQQTYSQNKSSQFAVRWQGADVRFSQIGF